MRGASYENVPMIRERQNVTFADRWSDCYDIPPKTLAKMRGADVAVLDCLRDTRPHPTHLTLERALAYMDEIAPRRGYFVHMCHDVKHAEFEARLPRGIRLTYDGMKIRV